MKGLMIMFAAALAGRVVLGAPPETNLGGLGTSRPAGGDGARPLADAERALVESAAMAPFYGELWNAETQARIDAEIEANRKADAAFDVPAPDGTPVEIEQVEHEFVFGAHIFNFDQLGKKEWNDRYKAMWGEGGLFNQATVAFYWRQYEPERGHARDDGAYEDTAAFWNAKTRKQAMWHPYWRRPSPGPVIAWCRERGVRVHGHCLDWANRNTMPVWTWSALCPKEERFALRGFGLVPGDGQERDWHKWARLWADVAKDFDDDAISAMLPGYAANARDAVRRHIEETIGKYGDLVDSWDVINESCCDWRTMGRKSRSGKPLRVSRRYGLVNGDQTLNALLSAKDAVGPGTLIAINDYEITKDYRDQIRDLQNEGARIDLAGCQMHIFKGDLMRRYADGDAAALKRISPSHIREALDAVAEAGLPIHVSEVTIPAPGTDDRSRAIQAVVTRNFYRACFAHKAVMGITWWNTVDRTYNKELLDSGLFTETMERKPVYDELDRLINGEWKTRLTVPVINGRVSFRGFRGRYSLSWVSADDGKRHVKVATLPAR